MQQIWLLISEQVIWSPEYYIMVLESAYKKVKETTEAYFPSEMLPELQDLDPYINSVSYKNMQQWTQEVSSLYSSTQPVLASRTTSEANGMEPEPG